MSILGFHIRGLGLPVHRFFRGLLHEYGLELHHLTPHGVLHIAVFITLCEAYLGIAPHFNLWQYFFWVRASSNSLPLPVVGGACIQLCGRQPHYFDLSLPTFLKGWHQDWLYIRNDESTLLSFTGNPPVYREAWRWGVPDKEMGRLSPVLEQVEALKAEGLMGEAILCTFLARRIQPIRPRDHTMWLYSGPDDPTRESPLELTEVELSRRV